MKRRNRQRLQGGIATFALWAGTLLAQQAAPTLQPLPHPELPPLDPLPSAVPAWIYVSAGLLIGILLSLVVWLLLRPRAASARALPRPWNDAMNALRRIEKETDAHSPGAVAGQVSEVLRQYFQARYQIPAPFRTTPEIFEQGLIPATSPRLQRYASLAELWDQLAFAPLPVTHAEARALVGKAITHLEEDRS